LFSHSLFRFFLGKSSSPSFSLFFSLYLPSSLYLHLSSFPYYLHIPSSTSLFSFFVPSLYITFSFLPSSLVLSLCTLRSSSSFLLYFFAFISVMTDWLLHCCWSSPAQRYLVPSPAGLRPYFTGWRLWEPSEISDECAVRCRLYL
jgi:hypothetical protein